MRPSWIPINTQSLDAFTSHIRREVGGEFSAFDGWVSGTTVELIPDKKIVQKWRWADWPQGHYSTVTFELQAQGQETRLDFPHVSLKIFM